MTPRPSSFVFVVSSVIVLGAGLCACSGDGVTTSDTMDAATSDSLVPHDTIGESSQDTVAADTTETSSSDAGSSDTVLDVPPPPEPPARPVVHFSVPSGWLNDPNGLVVLDGTFHLFYQHYPDMPIWGPMHWGHASGTDLVHWEDHGVALAPDDVLGTIYSGCALVDHDDVSGLCGDGSCPLVFFTHHGGMDGTEKQSVASSLDGGVTWVPYEGNPILPNPGVTDFRDPKVLWHEPSARWVMALAMGQEVALYVSEDLLSWSLASTVAPLDDLEAGPVECPDLFPLPDPAGGDEVWVLQAGVFEGGNDGGSGALYRLGTFDGSAFVPTDEGPRWVDHGADFYAAQSWSEVPDGRRIWVAWMSDWAYAMTLPTGDWNGTMTIPREVSLAATDGGGLALSQAPVVELEGATTDLLVDLEGVTLEGSLPLHPNARGHALVIHLQATGSGGSLTLGVHVGETEETLVVWEPGASLTVDRSASGATTFAPAFGTVHSASLAATTLTLEVVVDRYSVEVFAQDGTLVLTDLVFPDEASDGVSLVAEGGSFTIDSLTVARLQ